MEKEKLRPMYDAHGLRWKIVKASHVRGGGWRRFGGAWYITREDAQAAIDRIIAGDPDHYENG